MPQMAPINWLSLFFMFSIIFFIFNILNYYNYFLIYPSKNKNSMNNKSSSFYSWKW